MADVRGDRDNFFFFICGNAEEHALWTVRKMKHLWGEQLNMADETGYEKNLRIDYEGSDTKGRRLRKKE